MDSKRRQAFMGALRFPTGVYGIPWDPLDNEVLHSCKILLLGELGLESFECYNKNLVQAPLKHNTIPDSFFVRFNLGESHEIDVLFCILQNDATDISFRQKM